MADGTVITWTRVTEGTLENLGIKDPKKVGEARKDPSGMLWGGRAVNEKGEMLLMTADDAAKHCESTGARLPTGWPAKANGAKGPSSEFVRLREYMGAKKGDDGADGFTAQIFDDTKGAPNGDWEWACVNPQNRPDSKCIVHGSFSKTPQT